MPASGAMRVRAAGQAAAAVTVASRAQKMPEKETAIMLDARRRETCLLSSLQQDQCWKTVHGTDLLPQEPG
jgi:hypothetical protein